MRNMYIQYAYALYRILYMNMHIYILINFCRQRSLGYNINKISYITLQHCIMLPARKYTHIYTQPLQVEALQSPTLTKISSAKNIFLSILHNAASTLVTIKLADWSHISKTSHPTCTTIILCLWCQLHPASAYEYSCSHTAFGNTEGPLCLCAVLETVTTR